MSLSAPNESLTKEILISQVVLNVLVNKFFVCEWIISLENHT